jgi:hypothetical protein
VKNHWNSTLKRRRHDFAPGGPNDVTHITQVLQQKLARMEGKITCSEKTYAWTDQAYAGWRAELFHYLDVGRSNASCVY